MSNKSYCIILGKSIGNLSFQWRWGYQWTNSKCILYVSTPSMERNFEPSNRSDWKFVAGMPDKCWFNPYQDICVIQPLNPHVQIILYLNFRSRAENDIL